MAHDAPRIRSILAVATMAAGCLLGSAAPAQELLGPAFVLNTITTATHGRVARSSDDEMFAVWTAVGGPVDTDSTGIRGRCFDGDASPLGAEFQVNSHTTGPQFQPEVARNAAGATVVVWVSEFTEVRAQRYDSVCAPVGSEIVVAQVSPIWLRIAPVVAVDTSGAFFVAWESTTSTGTDSSSVSIQARRYDASGVALGAAFQVNTTTLGDQIEPSISIAGNDTAVVTWCDDETDRIMAQRFDVAGAAVGGEMVVGTGHPLEDIGGWANWSAVAHFPNDGFVVVWVDRSSGDTIQARRYDDAGSPLGAVTRVDTPYASFVFHLDPVVDADSAGGFVVLWPTAEFGEDLRILGQRYDGAGTAVGNNFTVAGSPHAQTLRATDISFDSTGEYIVLYDRNQNVEARISGMPALPAFGGLGRFVLIACTLAAGIVGSRVARRA